MNKPLLWVFGGGGIIVIGYFIALRLTDPETASASPPSDEITYLCRETGKLIRGPRDLESQSELPGGCETLVQALYCPTCQAWYPFPPAEALERMPMGPVCPKHRTGLV